MSMTFVDESELLQADVVASRLKVSRRYVTYLCQRGKIAHLRIGRRILFPKEAVNDFLRKCEVPVFIQPEPPPLTALDIKLGRFKR